MASLQLEIPDDDSSVLVLRRVFDDLPAHVKGSAFWQQRTSHTAGYYFTHPNEAGHPITEPVEFINHSWYGLAYVSSIRKYTTRLSYRIARGNIAGLGWWNPEDPQNPERVVPPSEPTTRSGYRAPASSDSSPESVHTPQQLSDNDEPRSPTRTEPPPSIAAITIAAAPLTPPRNPTPLPPPPPPPINVPMAAPPPAPANNHAGLKGVAPSIFSGDRSRSDAFLNEFRRYKLLNRNNDSISVPFYRVLTALSYIKGPLVEDWVNAQDKKIERSIDPTNPARVAETDEVIWQTFEADFRSAWKDTTRTQSAYDQLMKLTMKDLDVDTYTATFERLAAAAEWEADAKGTIARYRFGLNEGVHRRILNRETLPTNMDEWKTAARKEVNRIREIQNAGFTRKSFTPGPFHTNQAPRPPQNNRSSGVVPMDVDAITQSPAPFRKLTDDERKKYMAEGRCFRCRIQGHMARNCPKNAGRAQNAAATTLTPTAAIVTTAPPDATPSTASTVTQTKAQMIQALEDAMTEEERGEYLDARDMGEDFCSAEF